MILLKYYWSISVTYASVTNEISGDKPANESNYLIVSECWGETLGQAIPVGHKHLGLTMYLSGLSVISLHTDVLLQVGN